MKADVLQIWVNLLYFVLHDPLLMCSFTAPLSQHILACRKLQAPGIQPCSEHIVSVEDAEVLRDHDPMWAQTYLLAPYKTKYHRHTCERLLVLTGIGLCSFKSESPPKLYFMVLNLLKQPFPSYFKVIKHKTTFAATLTADQLLFCCCILYRMDKIHKRNAKLPHYCVILMKWVRKHSTEVLRVRHFTVETFSV